MENQEIAKNFDLLAKLMELHDENPFKIKSYAQAYATLRKIEKPLDTMSTKELGEIPGVGQAISDKISEMIQTGQMKTLEVLKSKTPPGIIDMLKIRGFGPKKVKQIWRELDIETIGELLYACNENRIAALRGFGMKTQEELIKMLEYTRESKDKFLFQSAVKAGEALLEHLSSKFPGYKFGLTGDISLQLPIVKGVELLTTLSMHSIDDTLTSGVETETIEYQGVRVFISVCEDDNFVAENFSRSCSPEFLSSFTIRGNSYASEADIFTEHGFPFIHPARRDNMRFLTRETSVFPPLDHRQFKGCIHNHTTYSDGISTLREMQEYAAGLNYEYIIITDHSQSAFYAKGLKEEDLFRQWAEIDEINALSTGAFIVKGIESDILNDGNLDYPSEILSRFECVIASVHSNLKMDVDKATKRLISAIENPYTKILGHPTGRLLLSRPGYPVKMQYIIDACAANGVALELNANPRRLDIDYTFLDYCMLKDTLISINPDAHSAEAVRHVEFGVSVAQKVNLDPDKIINTWDLARMKKWLAKN